MTYRGFSTAVVLGFDLPPPKPGTHFGLLGPVLLWGIEQPAQVAAEQQHSHAVAAHTAYQRGFADATKFYVRIG